MLKPVILIVLDGWGLAPPGPGNAISLAKLTNIPRYWGSFPHGLLAASGEAVGLPAGEDGNTETGHINIGAGRVVYQDLPRINMSIADGSFYRNQAFLGAIRFVEQHHSTLHIMGLLSDSGVHASREHLYALLEMVKRQNKNIQVYLHVFTDGRDSPPRSGLRFISELENHCQSIGVGRIATVMGRYFGMDRDRRWERTQKAYIALTEKNASTNRSALETVKEAYAKNITDEFIEPTAITDNTGNSLPRISNNDAVIFYNYRIDRPRQLTRAFVLPNFEVSPIPVSFDPYAVKYFHKHVVTEDTRDTPFQRNIVLSNIFFVTMTEYERDFPCVVAFPPEPLSMTLGKALAIQKLRQLHAAETEKERFVTYYFNGMHETPFPGEDRLIIPSPKVATYDLKPEMSAPDLTEKFLERLQLDLYSFAIVNLANPDMVAHTGNIKAAIRACEVTDTCVGKIVSYALAHDGTCIITGDHGNVEEMLGPSGEMDTEHSTFPVPFMIIAKDFEGYAETLPNGKLADIAPTILTYLHIPVPNEMNGKDLLADFVPKGGTT